MNSSGDKIVLLDGMGSGGDYTANSLLSMIPGLGNRFRNAQIDEKRIERTKAIILSMTPAERRNPDLLNASRKRRVAAGSGSSIQDVNQLLKQYEQTNQMMKSMRGKRGGKMPF